MRLIVLTVIGVLVASVVWGGDYRYVSAGDLLQKMEKNEKLVLLDIQVEKEFEQHHIDGAVATYAYPVKSEADRSRLDTVLAQLLKNDQPVVIVCPRGGGGAKRTYDYLKAGGVPESRMTILKGGQENWPY